jgi:hypothetical protein
VPNTIQNPASWQAGFEAAHCEEPYIFPKNVEHHQSFSLGYIEGQPAPDRIQARGELKPFWLVAAISTRWPAATKRIRQPRIAASAKPLATSSRSDDRST